MDKQPIINNLRAFIRQRPEFEPGNYGSWRDYRNESARATRDARDAEYLLREVERRDSISAVDILKAVRGGRLSIDAETGAVDYCTGQYFCVEFRPAAARLCASVLWNWLRDGAPIADADSMRRRCAREFPKRIAARYFS